MIIDCHYHLFPPLGGPAGFQTTREHMRHAQGLMFHRSLGRRLPDNALVVGGEWHRGEDPDELDFRGGSHGRFLWTARGVDYARYYLPPTMARLESTPEMMLAQMDYVGVDRAVVQAGHTYGRLNDFISGVVRRHRDRLWGLCTVEEWQLDDPGQIRALDHAINDLGLHGLFFNSASIGFEGRPERLDDAVFRPFWERVRDLGIPVFWNVTANTGGAEGWLEEQARFGRWTERYPEITCIYTHGLPLYRFIRGGRVAIPEEAWGPLEAPNVLSEILIPILQGYAWDYPFTEARPVIREYYERLGPEKLVWGSDMPNVERHCTYRQSLEYLTRYCDFIPPADMEKICGGNIERALGARS
ncbi:MAG: amidohydrolase family protein [Dehalococcoidia bacterium]